MEIVLADLKLRRGVKDKHASYGSALLTISDLVLGFF